MTNEDFAKMLRRVADRSFSSNLARGGYPSSQDPDTGEHTHDRHVLIHFRNAEALLREAADRLEGL